MKGMPMYEARAALATHPRCGAHCRTTGWPCRNPAMANGRCRMHGGKSTGRPLVNGRYTKAALAQRAQWLAAERELRATLDALEQGAFNSGQASARTFSDTDFLADAG